MSLEDPVALYASKLYLGIMRRVSSGIDELDLLLGGGFLRGSNILIRGNTGTGKTILCCHFLVAGAKNNEKGIFISCDENHEDLRVSMSCFGWDLRKLEENEMLLILDLGRQRRYHLGRYHSDIKPICNDLIAEVETAFRQLNVQRLVFDSIDGLEAILGDFLMFKKFVFHFSTFLIDLGLTSLITTRFGSEGRKMSHYTGMELLCRGIVDLFLEEHGHDSKRVMRIQKMVGTRHTLRKIPYEILSTGIEISTGGIFEV